ncbi:hypothetical protein ScPMuIL_006219 [Solemya velum]
MDFSKFRNTGDLTDITVLVEGIEFKLHKFPLFAKSDFFCNLARSHGADRMRVDLKDFPGGTNIFSVIADYCYSVKIDVTKSNIVPLRCASEYLQMTGKGNLSEITEKFLHDTITSAKMSRSTNGIISLLLGCVSAGPLAEKVGIVKLCSEGLVECWLKPPTKFSVPNSSRKEGKDRTDEKSMKTLMTMPLEWFTKLLIAARNKRVSHSQIADIAVHYISSVMENDEHDEKQSRKNDSSDAAKSMEKPKTPDFDLVKDAKISPEKTKKKTDVVKTIDAIIMEVPEEAMREDCVTMDWLTKVLRVTMDRECKCRRVLLKLAAESLSKLSSDDLCIISPSLLREIVEESSNGENKQSEKASKIVDTYMSEMARKGVLTAETFKMLSVITPKESKPDQDRMFEISEYFLNTEKEKLTKEQLEELLGSVDFTRLSSAALSRALEKEVVPAIKVARGALALCSRLEQDVSRLKSEAREREEQILLLQKPSPVNLSLSSDQTTPPPPPPQQDLSPSLRELSLEEAAVPKGSEDNLRSRGFHRAPLTETRRPLSFQPLRPAARAKDTRMNTPATAQNSYRPYYTDSELNLDEELRLRYDNPFRTLDMVIKSRSSDPLYGSPYTYSYLNGHRY